MTPKQLTSIKQKTDARFYRGFAMELTIQKLGSFAIVAHSLCELKRLKAELCDESFYPAKCKQVILLNPKNFSVRSSKNLKPIVA